MDRAKILDKIKKCLELSKSPNEHEAAAALRQAQKLMDRHGITEGDIGAVGYGKEKVTTATQVGKKQTLPVTLTYILDLIRHAFGVRPVVTPELRETDYNWSIIYYGPENRVLLAAYTHTVIARAVEAAWQTALKEHPLLKGRPGGRAGFYAGWIRTVREAVEEFAMTPEETAGVDIVLRNEGKQLEKSKVSKTGMYSSAIAAGSNAGKDFKLHRPVGQERLRIGKQ